METLRKLITNEYHRFDEFRGINIDKLVDNARLFQYVHPIKSHVKISLDDCVLKSRQYLLVISGGAYPDIHDDEKNASEEERQQMNVS